MSPPVTRRNPLPPGTRVHEYELEEVLGLGASGIAYRCRHTLLDNVAFIREYMPEGAALRDRDGNVLPMTGEDEEDYRWGLERFLDNARMLSSLDHPCIVRMDGFFEAHGTVYVAMEYLEGQTLGDLFQSSTVSERRLRPILTQILDALERVHDLGLLHRNINPRNILFRGDDSAPVLIDFDGAGLRDRTDRILAVDVYCPIEQFGASGEHMDGPWTDIYAMGAVLYRSMTGTAPPPAYDRILKDRLDPAGRAARGRYSRSLTDAVDWALRLRAEDRPQTVREWREVLDGGGKPSPKTGTGGGKATRNRLWLVILVIAAALAAAGVIYW